MNFNYYIYHKLIKALFGVPLFWGLWIDWWDSGYAVMTFLRVRAKPLNSPLSALK